MIHSTNRIVLVTIVAVFCTHQALGWYLPIVQRSSSQPIIRILDPMSHDHNAAETKARGYDELENNWLALGQKFMPKVDEISYVQSFASPRKLGRSEHKKLKDGGAVNPNHFHFRVTR